MNLLKTFLLCFCFLYLPFAVSEKKSKGVEPGESFYLNRLPENVKVPGTYNDSIYILGQTSKGAHGVYLGGSVKDSISTGLEFSGQTIKVPEKYIFFVEKRFEYWWAVWILSFLLVSAFLIWILNSLGKRRILMKELKKLNEKREFLSGKIKKMNSSTDYKEVIDQIEDIEGLFKVKIKNKESIVKESYREKIPQERVDQVKKTMEEKSGIR